MTLIRRQRGKKYGSGYCSFFRHHRQGIARHSFRQRLWRGGLGRFQGRYSRDIIQIDSNGYIDQAAAAGAAINSSLDVGVLHGDVASTVAADSTDALAVPYRCATDETVIWLPYVNNSDTYVTVTNALLGNAVGLYRRSDGVYAWDANTTTHGIVVALDATRGLLGCKLIEANRLK